MGWIVNFLHTNRVKCWFLGSLGLNVISTNLKGVSIIFVCTNYSNTRRGLGSHEMMVLCTDDARHGGAAVWRCGGWWERLRGGAGLVDGQVTVSSDIDVLWFRKIVMWLWMVVDVEIGWWWLMVEEHWLIL